MIELLNVIKYEIIIIVVSVEVKYDIIYFLIKIQMKTNNELPKFFINWQEVNEEEYVNRWDDEEWQEKSKLVIFYVIWFVIIIWLIIFWFFFNKKVESNKSNIEIIRLKTLQEQSWSLTEVNKQIQDLKKQLDNKIILKEDIKNCIDINSNTWVVVDCNIVPVEIKNRLPIVEDLDINLEKDEK